VGSKPAFGGGTRVGKQEEGVEIRALVFLMCRDEPAHAVVEALEVGGGFHVGFQSAGLVEGTAGWAQQHSDQDADDGEDAEEFDQGEGSLGGAGMRKGSQHGNGAYQTGQRGWAHVVEFKPRNALDRSSLLLPASLSRRDASH